MADNNATAARSPCQTLMRGLDIIEAVANGVTDLPSLSAALGTTRSTTHRLAMALQDRRYLNFAARTGYSLGPKLLELGFRTQQSMHLPRIARPFLEALSESCDDTIHLGVLDGIWALYLDKLPGRRRLEIRSRVGERHPVWSTGLGKALILDLDETAWRRFHAVGEARGANQSYNQETWLACMRRYAASGVAYDLEENEPQVRCVASPIRDASGKIVAAFSVSSIVPYMNDDRMTRLSDDLKQTALQISGALGWSGC